jgi:hypothetical protein
VLGSESSEVRPTGYLAEKDSLISQPTKKRGCVVVFNVKIHAGDCFFYRLKHMSVSDKLKMVADPRVCRVPIAQVPATTQTHPPYCLSQNGEKVAFQVIRAEKQRTYYGWRIVDMFRKRRDRRAAFFQDADESGDDTGVIEGGFEFSGVKGKTATTSFAHWCQFIQNDTQFATWAIDGISWDKFVNTNRLQQQTWLRNSTSARGSVIRIYDAKTLTRVQEIRLPSIVIPPTGVWEVGPAVLFLVKWAGEPSGQWERSPGGEMDTVYGAVTTNVQTGRWLRDNIENIQGSEDLGGVSGLDWLRHAMTQLNRSHSLYTLLFAKSGWWPSIRPLFFSMRACGNMLMGCRPNFELKQWHTWMLKVSVDATGNLQQHSRNAIIDVSSGDTAFRYGSARRQYNAVAAQYMGPGGFDSPPGPGPRSAFVLMEFMPYSEGVVALSINGEGGDGFFVNMRLDGTDAATYEAPDFEQKRLQGGNIVFKKPGFFPRERHSLNVSADGNVVVITGLAPDPTQKYIFPGDGVLTPHVYVMNRATNFELKKYCNLPSLAVSQVREEWGPHRRGTPHQIKAFIRLLDSMPSNVGAEPPQDTGRFEKMITPSDVSISNDGRKIAVFHGEPRVFRIDPSDPRMGEREGIEQVRALIPKFHMPDLPAALIRKHLKK